MGTERMLDGVRGVRAYRCLVEVCLRLHHSLCGIFIGKVLNSLC